MLRRIKHLLQRFHEGTDDLRKLREIVEQLHKQREAIDALNSCERQLRTLVRQSLWETVRQSPWFNDPKRLLASAFKVYSQGMEDGMIAEVFRRIGTTSKRFIEFGVEDGLECNSAFLLVQGWNGAWIEGSAEQAERVRAHFKDYAIQVVNDFVTLENADMLIGRLAGQAELDLLSIDIDSNDYWIWDAIRSITPRVVIIEYNATFPPYVRKTVAHDPALRWNGSNYFGASLGAFAALGEKKGYCLVGCSPSGVNAFFVRADLVADHFAAPFTAENHYQKPCYALDGPSGHRPGMGRWVDV